MGAVSNPVVLVQMPGRQTMRNVVAETLDVGRDCDVLIVLDPAASRRHLVLDLAPEDGHLIATDLDSSNGTFFQGHRIVSPTVIGPGQHVSIGDCTLTVLDQMVTATDSSREFSRTIVDRGPTSTSIDRLADSAKPTGGAIDHAGATRESGTLTIVFSDIENSTARSSDMGDTKWMQVLNQHTALVTKKVKANRGRIVKNQGDAFMMTFQSARQAILACVGIQRELEDHPDEKVRIGLHTGEGLMDRQGGVFGDHVNKAARVSSLAEGGQIVVSDLVQRITVSRGDLVFAEPVQAMLKGITNPAIVYELLWRQSKV
jgi:class 3 adenylate cyclase